MTALPSPAMRGLSSPPCIGAGGGGLVAFAPAPLVALVLFSTCVGNSGGGDFFAFPPAPLAALVVFLMSLATGTGIAEATAGARRKEGAQESWVNGCDVQYITCISPSSSLSSRAHANAFSTAIPEMAMA